MARPAIAILLALGVAIGGCSSAAPATPDGLPPAPTTDAALAYSSAGPYAAGVAVKTTRQGDPVVITYPVDKAATKGHAHYRVDLLRWFLGDPTAAVPSSLAALHLPTTLATTGYGPLPVSAGGPFPVVLFSHGFGGYPEQSSFLTVHLATWGFVVVAPDHRSRDLHAVLSNAVQDCACDVTDLTQALAYVTSSAHTKGSLLDGKLDLGRVASLGHSAGGGAAIAVAADPAVRTYIGLAPVAAAPPPAGKPGLIVQGVADQVVPVAGTTTLYDGLRTPKRLVLIAGAGHNEFADACSIGASSGGLPALVHLLNVPASFAAIATDGCSPPDIDPPTAWPLVDHVVVAQLRWGLGIDAAPVGLGPGFGTAYRGVHATVTTAAAAPATDGTGG
jgi:fermentation-respiration switch protein FrsA (DUF1100 family)